MRTFFIYGVQFDICDKWLCKVLEAVEQTEKALVVIGNDTIAYDSDEYRKTFQLGDGISNLVDETWNTDMHDLVYGLYKRFNAMEDKRYHDFVIADFREYETHKGEDDFDWNFYSDWHKDIFGFRPRW